MTFIREIRVLKICEICFIRVNLRVAKRQLIVIAPSRHLIASKFMLSPSKQNLIAPKSETFAELETTLSQ